MNISDMNGEACHVIEALHEESGFSYRLPEFMARKPLFPVQRVVRENGQFIAAGILKVDAEAYLFMNHEAGTPEERFAALQALHEDVVSRAREIGFDQIYCVLPPDVEKSFAPRLQELGWQRDRGWTRMTLEL